ncbi:hypothetical protein ABPG74_001765 [Tetrahymena malaccensis]
MEDNTKQEKANKQIEASDEDFLEQQIQKKQFFDRDNYLTKKSTVATQTSKDESTLKSCMKKGSQNFEKQIFAVKKRDEKQINWNEDKQKIAIPNIKSIYSKYLINGIKPQIVNQIAYNIYEGILQMADSGLQSQVRVCLNSYHERSDLKILPKLFLKPIMGDTSQIDYFVKKNISQEMKREINIMKQMQMSNYQRFFCGWVEASKKEQQDEINKIAEKLYEHHQYFEFKRDGLYNIKLIHCENLFQEYDEVIVDHVNFKVITQLCFLIQLPLEYYQRFVVIQECL